MRRRRGLIIGAVALVLLLAGVGAVAWYIFGGDDPPPPPTLRDAPVAKGDSTGSPDGRWTLGGKPGFVGYRVEELFAGETLRKDAVGRTTEVTGALVFADGQLRSVKVAADLTALESDRAPRDSFLRDNALETDRFPTASFEVRDPKLPAPPPSGQAFDVPLTGELALHGVTRTTTFNLRVRRSGDRIDVVGTAPIQLDDFEIETPNTAVVATEDHGDIEVDLTFRRR